MKYRFIIIAALLLAANPGLSGAVLINNRTVNIDLSDIINPGKSEYSGLEVKQLCAKITERYHSSGYTAFYIKQALIRKDGSIELFFNESRVSGIIITGVSGEDESRIRNDLYFKDEIFNELILKKNIKSVKDKYSINKVTVNVVRVSNGDVELDVAVKKKIIEGNIGISTSPLYGASMDTALKINLESADVNAYFKSTLRQEKAGYTAAGIGFTVPYDKAGCFLNIDYTSRDDAPDNAGSSFYSSNTAKGDAGFFLQHGALNLKLYLLSSYVDYDNYDEYGSGVSLTGGGFSAVYNDSGYKIDQSDATIAGLEISAGRNLSNEYSALTMKLYGTLNFPLFSAVSLTCDFNSDYTTGNERLLQFYVFDGKIPLRKEDYTVSAWRNSVSGGVRFEAVEDMLFIVPEYIAALYDSGGTAEIVDGYGLRLIAVLNTFKFEASCFFERGGAVNDGVLLFSASGSF